MKTATVACCMLVLLPSDLAVAHAARVPVSGEGATATVTFLPRPSCLSKVTCRCTCHCIYHSIIKYNIIINTQLQGAHVQHMYASLHIYYYVEAVVHDHNLSSSF